MNEVAIGTLARADKGKVAPPPALEGPIGEAAQVVMGWPDVIATTHWNLFDPSRVDGIDFYVGEQELGHIHLDGELHLATSPRLGAILVGEKRARAFRYQRGWVCESVERIGPDAAVALFRRNYDALKAGAA